MGKGAWVQMHVGRWASGSWSSPLLSAPSVAGDPTVTMGEWGQGTLCSPQPGQHLTAPSAQLTASNHVSNVTVNYNVTVERMQHMRDLRVSAVPTVLPPNGTLVLAASVLVDSAVEAAFL